MTHRNYDKFPFQLYRLIILFWEIIDVVFRNGNVITFQLVRGGGGGYPLTSAYTTHWGSGYIFLNLTYVVTLLLSLFMLNCVSISLSFGISKIESTL